MNPAKQLLQARLMVTFARVVECGSISAAALSLGVDKAGVSRQISDLEQLLGVRLLNRSTRKLCLTDIGGMVYERATRVVTELESAYTEAEYSRSTPSGVLTISTSVAFGIAHVVPSLGQFAERYPDVRIDLCLLDRQVDPVEEGVDLLLRLCDRPPENMIALKLAEIDYVLVATPAFLASHPPLRQAGDLAQVNCLFYGYRKHSSVWSFQSQVLMQEVTVHTRQAINSSQAIKSLALQGLGVALVPGFAVAEELHRGELVQVLPELRPKGYLGSALYAIYPPSRYPSPKLRCFLAFLKDDWLPRQSWIHLLSSQAARPRDGVAAHSG